MPYPQLVRVALVVTGTCWAIALAVGVSKLWRFSSTAGSPGHPPLTWPVEASFRGKSDLPTLVLFIHPHCPCSRATLDELAQLMTDCNGKLLATVLVLRSENAAQGWEQTGLWRRAASIPGVVVRADDRGNECHRFGAATSGQANLYSLQGQLLFSGGITESRGHSGDNAGRSTITALVMNPARASREQPYGTPVYGCPLFDESSGCIQASDSTCRK